MIEVRDGYGDDGSPDPATIEYLRDDPIRNLFAIYDLLREPENTALRLAVENDRVTGYLLRYTGLSHPNVIIRGTKPAVRRLLDEVGGEKILLFLDSGVFDLAKTGLNPTAVIPEDLMVVGSRGATLPKANVARKLCPEDANSILALYSGDSRMKRDSERYAKWAERHVVYGVFSGGVLASVAGTWAECDEGWIIGGVYTSPMHRRKGLATMAVGAVTERALMSARQASLYVVSSNEPAIQVYKNLGCKKVGERLWIDLGTGERPLTAEEA